MKSRLELSELLHTICDHCYFSPPNGHEMKYPCIVYDLSDDFKQQADNIGYKIHLGYTLTLIDEDPDSELFFAILGLPYCRFDRKFTSDNLNHFVFTIFY